MALFEKDRSNKPYFKEAVIITIIIVGYFIALSVQNNNNITELDNNKTEQIVIKE